MSWQHFLLDPLNSLVQVSVWSGLGLGVDILGMTF